MYRTWFSQWLRRISKSPPACRDRRRLLAQPRLEALEGRCLPSCNVFVNGRVLHADCDDRGNFVRLDHLATRTQVNSVSIPDASLDSILINTGNGNAFVVISGTVKPTTVNTGVGSDTVNIGEPVTVLDMRAPITVHGQAGGPQTLVYNDQANLTGALTYTLAATGTAAGRVQRIGLADLTYTGISNLAVNTGTVGNQTVNVLSTAFPMSTTVNGGRGNNTFNVGDANDRLQTEGLLTINGGSGPNNLLTIHDQGTTVRGAAYAIAPTFVSRPLGGALATNYSNIGTLVVKGGSGGNSIFVNNLNPTTNTFIVAGDGDNAINIGTGEIFPHGSLMVNGGRGTNNLVVDDHVTPTPQAYSLTGSSAVRNGSESVIRHSGMTSVLLRAGGGGNTITAANLGGASTAIIAGVGGDAVTVFGFQPAALAVSDPTGAATLVVDESFVSTPQSYAVTASALSRTGAGSISYAGLSSVQLLTSQGADTVAVNSTAAGTDTQVFTGPASNTFRMGIGPFNGTLTLNGSGTDKLDYSAYNTDVYVNLQTGEATNLTAFSGIRDITAGRGNNILVGDGHGNTLIGGNGRNLLIAGGSDFSGQGDSLVGGSDDDILIAGFTDYDMDKDSLRAILAAWTVFSFYGDRVAALTTGNGVPLLDATTVHSNGGNNGLVGNAGFDLFYANPDRDRTDADPESEVVVAIF